MPLRLSEMPRHHVFPRVDGQDAAPGGAQEKEEIPGCAHPAATKPEESRARRFPSGMTLGECGQRSGVGGSVSLANSG